MSFPASSRSTGGSTRGQTAINDPTWQAALDYMSRRVKKQSFSTWFRPTHGAIRPLPDGSEALEVSVPNQFVADWLREKYLPLIEEALRETCGKKYEILFGIKKRSRELDQTEMALSQASHMTTPSYTSAGSAKPPERIDASLNERYRFNRMVVGNFNEFAYAASVAVAEKPGATKYNPLVIYGGVGLGKTHLAQSIGQAALEKKPSLRVKYVTSEKFTQDFIDSLSSSTTSDFSSSYRSVDVLLVDDIQFFGGKESTQEQFFHTFNALYNAGKQIVLTADRRPHEIKGLEARLLSRFNSGLVTDIQTPDLEARIAILKKKLDEYDFAVGEDILNYIASRITTNIRELEGALTHLYARASLDKVTHITHDFAVKALADILRLNQRAVSVERIQEAISETFEVPVAQLKAKRRTAHIALARQAAMYLTRSLTGRSLQRIGQDFGGRDHSTVIHACSLVEDKLGHDNEFEIKIQTVKEALLN